MKKHWFKLVLISLALVCAVAIWGVLDSLWNAMVQYEAASEIGAVTEYFDCFAAGDYETAAATSGFLFDERNSKEDYVQYLKDTFGSDFSDLRFAGRDGDAEGEKIYRIYAGDTALGEVCLLPVEGQARQWKVVARVVYADPVSVVAPSYVTVFANGVAVEAAADATAVPHEDFASLTAVFDVPTKVSYSLEGYLFSPSVTGSAPDGTPCGSTVGEDGTIVMTVPPTAAQGEQYEQLMIEFSQLYAKFISEDATFSQLKSKIDRSCPFYTAVAQFDNHWYVAHTGFEFRNTEITDVVRPAEGFFSGTIRFDHVVFRNAKEHVYPSAYRLSFRLVDGQWLLADLKIL